MSLSKSLKLCLTEKIAESMPLVNDFMSTNFLQIRFKFKHDSVTFVGTISTSFCCVMFQLVVGDDGNGNNDTGSGNCSGSNQRIFDFDKS